MLGPAIQCDERLLADALWFLSCLIRVPPSERRSLSACVAGGRRAERLEIFDEFEEWTMIQVRARS